MPIRAILLAAAIATASAVVRADETLYRYEGNVLPYEAAAGWQVFDPCEPPCSEAVGTFPHSDQDT